MPVRCWAVLCVLWLAAGMPEQPRPAQQPAPPTKAASEEQQEDYAQEPFVIDKLHVRVRFEPNGTGRREMLVRWRVQSEAGVQRLGQLVFDYNAASERLAVNAVEVHKADGTVVKAGPDAVQDLTAPVAREAPVYTDLRQKHVTVPSLRPGETLEYRLVTEIHTPLAPGHFWFEHEFEEGAIVLDERLEVDVPRDRSVQVKTRAGRDPVVEESGARKVFRWQSSHRKRKSQEKEQGERQKAKREEHEQPAVQMTTFRSWEELGRWYAALERDRARPTAEIRARAGELIRGRATDREKVEALYDYVARNVRYVSLSFGVGRFQPHAAAEVLANQYGDCKDKHTLLAALLEAAGLRAYPALIHSQRKLARDLPSPGQFDHLITAVPLAGGLLWLDTTAEVAPFGMLAANLRGKQALLIPREGAPRLENTPADPPFPSRQLVEVEGTISAIGKLTARVRYQLRGDSELPLRMAFRRTPRTQWKQLAGWVAWSDGVRGEVDDVQASNPESTREPFEFSYQSAQAGFLDWSSKTAQVELPLPEIGLPQAEAGKEPDAEPIELGTPFEVTLRMRLEWPANYSTRPPVPVQVKRDYGEYRSSYQLEGNVLLAERFLKLTTRALPPARALDYMAFVRAVRTDEGQKLTLETTRAGAPQIPADTKTEDLYQGGLGALRSGNFRVAVTLLERVVAAEPQHKGAWNNLGLAYLGLRELDKAADAFTRQIAVNPYDEYAHNNLGRTFWMQQKYEEAIAAFRKQLAVNPLDRWAHANLGLLYRERRMYPQAVESLETAISITPGNAALHVGLGQSYLNLGQQEKALAAFDKAVELAPSPTTWNNVAYELSLHHVHLERAQQYAESAVAATGAELRNVALDRLTALDLGRVAALAAYWDTLGWVHFQKGELDKAEPLIRASWQLNQHGEVGDHLGQIYEKAGRKDLAMRAYAQALAGTRPAPETRGRLVALAGEEKVQGLVDEARQQLSDERTIPLGKLPGASAEADFFVLLAPGAGGRARAEAVKLLRGNEALRTLAEKLRAADYKFAFPPGNPTKLVRRGTLSCSASGECVFVLSLPDDVTSAD